MVQYRLWIVSLLCISGFIIYNPALWNIIPAVMAVMLLLWKCIAKQHFYRLENKSVLITGCDFGFGHEIALSLAHKGITVFATCLNGNGEGAKLLKEKTQGASIHILEMDIQKMDDVIAARNYVQQNLGDQSGLWGLVNNAGFLIPGDIELMTIPQFQKIIDINLMGTVRVTKTFIPFVRKSKGRIVNVTSIRGLMVDPLNAAYTASKFAGEAFVDTLRLEMAKFGVKVSAIQPCNFSGATKMFNLNTFKLQLQEMWKETSQEQRFAYGEDYIDCLMTELSKIPLVKCSLSPMIEAVEDALFNIHPRTKYMVQSENENFLERYKLLAHLKPLIPDWLYDKIVLEKYL